MYDDDDSHLEVEYDYDNIYGGQFYDGEEDNYTEIGWSYDKRYGCDQCVAYKKEQEKQVSKSEWIELDIDPFSNNDFPVHRQRVVMWNSNTHKSIMIDFSKEVDYMDLGYTHWMPEPEGPVTLLRFSGVVEGLRYGKKYKRINGMQILYTTDSQVSVYDTQQNDWVEV